MFSKEDIEQALGVKIAISEEMQANQELWRDTFNGRAYWNDEETPSLMIAKGICKKVAKLTTLNFESEITGSPTADYLNEQYKRVISVSGKNGFRATNEKGNKNGTLVGRVFLRNFVESSVGLNQGDLFVDWFETDTFYPIAFNERGDLIDCVFRYLKIIDDSYYTLLERCIYDNKNKIFSISYTAWISDDERRLGRPTSLSSVDDWSSLKGIYQYYNVEKPWFKMFVMPEIGTEEQRSEMGSALFANAINNIKKADEQEARTDWEFVSGERAIDSPADLFRESGNVKDINGNVNRPLKLPKGKERLYRINQGSVDDGVMMKDFSPEIRNEPHKDRLNQIKRNIESDIGVAHGTISDVNEVQRTATEVQHGREDTGSTVKEIQDTWQVVLTDIVDIMYDMAIRYKLCLQGQYQTAFWWNDSIVVTQAEKQEAFNNELNRMKGLFADGIISSAELRAFYVENSDYFSKISPEAIEEAQESLPGVFADGEINNGSI